MQIVRFVGRVRLLALISAVTCFGGVLSADEIAVELKPVSLIVKLPAEATLELAGQKVAATGADRRFVIPPLEVGKKVAYEVKATWNVNGRPETTTMNIQVAGGQNHEVNFGGAAAGVGSAEEQQVLALCNSERARYGMSPLSLNECLNQAARGHSWNMARQGVMSHDLNGSFVGRIRAQAYPGMPGAENIAHGAGSPSAVVQMWMNSDGHRANILNPGFNELGVGQASGGYWTQVFGRR